MSTTSSLLSIAGLAVGAYGVYYLYTNGYVDKILGALKLPGGGGGSSTGTTPADTTGDTTDKPADTTTTPPASKCKSGELADSKGKCVKCATSLDSKDKCVKAKASTSGNVAQIMSHGYVAAYNGWQPHNFRITVG